MSLPDWQNQGIGRRLLIALFRRLVQPAPFRNPLGTAPTIQPVSFMNVSWVSGEPETARVGGAAIEAIALWLARPSGLSRRRIQRGPEPEP